MLLRCNPLNTFCTERDIGGIYLESAEVSAAVSMRNAAYWNTFIC